VIEDGTEYTDAFRNLAAGDAAASIEIVRAADFEDARRALAERAVDAVFLDVVFDRIAPEKLAGDWEDPIRRFGGDRRRAERHLAENQGFYLLNELASLLPEAMPVVIAYDFSAEPERLAALRRTWEQLTGIADGTPISRVLESVLAEVTDSGVD
jgi:ABC-type amino acid transport substrate-binding protein